MPRLSYLQHEGLAAGMNLAQVQVPWLRFWHVTAHKKGKKYDDYKELNHDQAQGLCAGLTREQVNHPWFRHIHAKAHEAGHGYEKYKELNYDQVEGLLAGLTREQVNHRWFRQIHVRAHKAGHGYEKYKELIYSQVEGLLAGLTREQVNFRGFNYLHIECIKAGVRWDQLMRLKKGQARRILTHYKGRTAEEIQAGFKIRKAIDSFRENKLRTIRYQNNLLARKYFTPVADRSEIKADRMYFFQYALDRARCSNPFDGHSFFLDGGTRRVFQLRSDTERGKIITAGEVAEKYSEEKLAHHIAEGRCFESPAWFKEILDARRNKAKIKSMFNGRKYCLLLTCHVFSNAVFKEVYKQHSQDESQVTREPLEARAPDAISGLSVTDPLPSTQGAAASASSQSAGIGSRQEMVSSHQRPHYAGAFFAQGERREIEGEEERKACEVGLAL